MTFYLQVTYKLVEDCALPFWHTHEHQVELNKKAINTHTCLPLYPSNFHFCYYSSI